MPRIVVTGEERAPIFKQRDKGSMANHGESTAIPGPGAIDSSIVTDSIHIDRYSGWSELVHSPLSVTFDGGLSSKG
ncbi:hypothetical protein ACFVUS_14850 [Nocardia sp. NPDC058058]|uniref:hypothetical protein n=1 Tax=Nocardia sp. NPDC058058 TaxID=3346317 RepID=UPI0036D7E882